MKIRRGHVFGFAVLLIAAIFTFTGCPTDPEDGGDDPGKVATPSAAPGPGAVTSGTSVALTSSTSGAIIYYTTDGSSPTSSSTQYSTPISITAAVTIKAIAVKADMTDSDVLTAAYTISGGGDPGTTNYTVSFSAGTGTGTPPGSQSVATGSSIMLPGATGMTPPSGQTFDGWQAQGGAKYAAGDSYTVIGDVTFIAQWLQSGPVFVPLTDGIWTNGSIESSSDLKRYSFYATGGTYHISWKDANGGGGGDGSYTCDVNVFGRREDGTQLFSGDDGIQFPQTISGYTGQVSILVEGATYGQNRTGTFAIKYKSGAPGAIKIVNAASGWTITAWHILESDRATVLINGASYPIPGNSDKTLEVSPGTYYVWVRIGSGVDSAYSSAITVTSGGTRTVRYTGSSLQVQ
jgi:hypothetical protein